MFHIYFTLFKRSMFIYSPVLHKTQAMSCLFFHLTNRQAQAVYIPSTHLHMTAAAMQVSKKDFEKAQEQLKLLKNDPGNEAKLKLYALFKQVCLTSFVS